MSENKTIDIGGLKHKKQELTAGQPILVVSNRYQPLSTCTDCDSESRFLTYEQNGRKCDKTTAKESKTKVRILIVGDSHTKGMAAELQHNLDKNYEVQGLVKSGADLEVILRSNMKECKKLTKEDILIIWGGTRDVSKNETQKGLLGIRKFIQTNLNTNVFVLSLPKRWDLEDQSCVNKEISQFNRKLSKYLKPFDHARYIEVKCDRKCHTRHGLHLNARGKEYIAKQLVMFIKVQPNRMEQIVLPLHWKKTQRQDGIKTSREPTNSGKHLAISSGEADKQQGKTPTTLPSKRQRRPPASRYDDFLW
ncbi:hypothetical protein B7P43_G04277 [Cryptotermes secundus]|uniref:SGNH hydrolase-type esterase domain-containing protein n=1 Tax=Cryptotermes secundus TaxID=105785 RepID=A0A2J7QFZ8_9NEOP|nr:hypothetical protein B7P43_G04277 [Cryptotermes secundus]